jgi:hypothetical protein
MVFLQVPKISTLPKESEMDDLEFEIQSAKNDLVRVALYWNADRLDLGDIALKGEDVNEVLQLVRRQAERKLARLTGLQTKGATA